MIAYQHWQFPSTALQWMAAAVLLLQTGIVGRAIAPLLPGVSAWIRGHISPGWRLLLVLALVGSSAVASRAPAAWGLELLVASFVQLVALGNVILLARTMSAGAAPPTPLPKPWRDSLVYSAALFAAVAAVVISRTAYGWHPHIPDEVGYLQHARYFADGRWWLPAPTVPDAFALDLMLLTGDRWFSPVPPGWPAILALGVKAGIPWLVNPLLAGGIVLLAHRVLHHLYDARTARLGALLLATSPWFVLMSINLLTHQSATFLALLAAIGVVRLREARADGQPTPVVSLALAGFAIAGVSLVRPLEGLLVALALGLWSLPPWRDIVRQPVRVLWPSALLALCTALGGAINLPYNALLTGDPTRFPLSAYVDHYYAPGANELGFGANRGLGWTGLDPFPGHGARDVVVNTVLNLAALNFEWLGWATGSLLPIVGFLAMRRWSSGDRAAVFMIVAVVAAHALYWFSGGPDFGARYWYLVIVPCAGLTARAILALDDTVGEGHAGRAGRTAALALVTSAWLTMVPWRAVDKYHHYRGMRPDVRTLARTHGFGRSVVLVRGQHMPDYASAATYNPLDLRADTTIYAFDASPAVRAAVLDAYPDRPVYFLDGPSKTGGDYRLAAGPLRGDAARAFAQP